MPETNFTRELIHHMFTELESPNKELTKWEEDFLESVRDQFDRRGSLSISQCRTLERIYTEKTA